MNWRKKKKKLSRPIIKLKKNWNSVILFFTPTRNNMFVNILDSEGIHLYRTSGGQLCYIKDYERRVKRTKDVLSFLAVMTAAFLREKSVKKLAFIFRHKWRFSLIFLKRVLTRNFPNSLVKNKRKKWGRFRLIFVGRALNLPFGGCRPGKRRNFRSERKKRNHTKRWSQYKSEIRQKYSSVWTHSIKINENV